MKNKSEFQKPSEYMRNRRPELFSDSKEVKQNTLPKNLLEYELENLTSKSKEKNFEHFCRKISEKEICPNLIPQTGPTGGGDSKTDTETYPVSKDIAQTWHTYEALQSANERWAFAFSAKKDWKPKVKSDVEGIVSTNRNYQRIYFISNQFIKDKDRATLEDELSKKYGTSIRILSREWLVEKVYTNNHLDIAISTLDIQGYSTTSDKVLGSEDYRRTKDLEELEANIKDSNRYVGVEWQLADDCLRAAQLIKSLEKPKDEILNAFARAKRIAETYKLNYQIFKINYHLAWTQFFWFDDVKEVLKLYPDIEKFCETSNQIDDTEKINNLFNILYGHCKQGFIAEEEVNLASKKEFLFKKLKAFVDDTERPATSLFAKSILVILTLTTTGSQENIKDVNEAYIEILKQSEGLIDFPTERILNLLREMEPVLEQADNYEPLFDLTVEITQKIESDVVAGNRIVERAKNAVDDKRYNEAIRLFGKSILYFAKDEYLNELVLSLHGIAISYEQQGLIWAARNSYVSAIERSLTVYWSERKLLPFLHKLINNLMWLEIRIGRPIHVMHWKELLGAILANTQLSNTKKKEFNDDLNMQDVINAILLMKTPFQNYSSLQELPDLYEYLDMPFSKTAALYSLGQLDAIRADKFIPAEDSTDEKLNDYISLWRKQPASRQIADEPSFEDTPVINLKSKLLSVDLNIFCESDTSTITLGEMILGVSESLWATALEERIYPHRKDFNVYIQKSETPDNGDILTVTTEVKNGETIITIKHYGLDLDLYKSLESRQKLKDKVLEIVIKVFSHIAYVDNLDIKMEKLFGKESALSRAMAFSDLYIALSSVFGNGYEFSTKRWFKNSDKMKKYELLRKTPLDEVEILPLKENEETTQNTDGPPEEIVNPEKAKHGSHQIESLIDVNLWNNATWRGTGFLIHPQIPLHLMLAFEDYEHGKQIFIGVKNKIGNVDTKGKIRLSIIKGIDKNNPFAYTVLFGSNVQTAEHGPGPYFVLSRINRMDPTNSTNLANFEKAYQSAKVCFIAPCSMKTFVPELQYAIQLKEIVIRNAWEIGENDMDISGVPEDCEPIIPAGIENPPIFNSIRYKKRN